MRSVNAVIEIRLQNLVWRITVFNIIQRVNMKVKQTVLSRPRNYEQIGFNLFELK